MKRIHLLYILLLGCISGAYAQNNNSSLYDETGYLSDTQVDPAMKTGMQDSSNVEIISLPPRLHMWKISEELGNIIPVPVDTTMYMFQNSGLNDGTRGQYNHLGNLGSPRMSRIFLDRKYQGPTLFLDPYNMFIVHPWEQRFTNSNIPYVNITYYTNFDKQDGEDRLKAYYTVNATKNLAFGFNFDYLYGRGYYSRQATSFLKGGLFGSYTGNRYQMHFVYNLFNQKMQENGGITDDRYITNPEEMAEGRKEFRSTEIPVNLASTYNYNRSYYVHYTHRYNLGFHREEPNPQQEGDSIEKFVPVTSFIHTIRYERSRHQFISNDNVEYANRYLDLDDSDNYTAKDTTNYIGIKNTFGISLLEGFNKYAKAGLTAFVSHKHSQYTLMNVDDADELKYKENEVFFGGELSKRSGDMLHYNALGEVGIAGEATGQFRLIGDADLNLKLFGDTLSFLAHASITNTLPSFYYRHYHGKYIWWDNDDLSKEFRSRISGELKYPRTKTSIKVGVENIKNYTYFGAEATPLQSGDNIQVMSAILRQNFSLGILKWENEVAWQKSSKEDILPLPKLTLYSNLYLDAKLAKKVLSVQLGADVRYFTEYKAPAYSPLIQNFHLQGDDAINIGAFPVVNVYANFDLKRTRFFVMLSHVNAGSGTPKYFLAPHYPINQTLFRFGLSWNFYD